MAITTIEKEKARLRSYLNPYLRGKNVDAVLEALAAGNSSYLINNAAAVNDSLYIVTASGDYLDQRLADYGITRPPAVGLSDELFRQIGIQVKNRKQVRDLINNILEIMFGDELVRATNKSRFFEPYDLKSGVCSNVLYNTAYTCISNSFTWTPGDTLTINFDGTDDITVEFNENEFENIHAATAQEVADAITKTLRTLGHSGTAIANNDGNGAYVELLSDTIGPASSVTVVGGSAQNALLFDSPIMAGGNAFTEWTITRPLDRGGIMRFTWSGGLGDPQLGRVSVGNYVNIFGGGFASSTNEGSYNVVAAVGGAVGFSYFEVENPIGTTGMVTQGAANAVLFFDPIRKTLASLHSYAAVYQTQGRLLQIFMPATTRVIRRSRVGSAHLHDAPNETFTFDSNANGSDIFSITTATSLVAGVDFVVGATAQATILNIATVINGIPGLHAIPGTTLLGIWQNDPALTLTGTYTGIASIAASGPLGDPLSVQPNQYGPYMFDLTQPFTVSNIGTVLAQDLDATMPRVFTVDDASQFPDEQGYLIFGYGTEKQEGPVPYTARPSSNTLLISPIYNLKETHLAGTDVAFVSLKAPCVISRDGLDYPFYITDVVSGRVYAQDLIDSVAATGINLVFTILYPNDIGLGKWDTVYSEISTVYGP